MVTRKNIYRFCRKVTSLYIYYIARNFRSSDFKLILALTLTLTVSFDFIWGENGRVQLKRGGTR